MLVALSRWRDFGVPYLVTPSSWGGARRICPWQSLGFEDPPKRPTWIWQRPNSPDALQYQEVADNLRRLGRHCDNVEELQRLESLVVTAQGLADDSKPDVFARRVLKSLPLGNVKQRRYRKHYFLKTFLVSLVLTSQK